MCLMKLKLFDIYIYIYIYIFQTDVLLGLLKHIYSLFSDYPRGKLEAVLTLIL